jgi:alanyl-tRNA synthetase
MVDAAVKGGCKSLPGGDVFALYDTYGFPMDLTRLMAAEKGLAIDEKEFDRLMEAQKARGREARRAGDEGLSPEGWIEIIPAAGTAFVGYDHDEAEVRVCRYKVLDAADGSTEYLLIFDRTPFYAASGGQTGDTGTLRTASGRSLSVLDTFTWNDLTVHRCVAEAPLPASDLTSALTASIDRLRRNAARRNHSATHLLQAALRSVLGPHVQQSGSRVDAGGLRFDFTHFKQVSCEELAEVEKRVNEWVLADLPVATEIKNPETAKKEGAIALFGEKYGDAVRVVSMGPVSKELCGGTHVAATGQIGLFHVTQESSIAAGVRRIEAVTGLASLKLLSEKEAMLGLLGETLKAGEGAIVERVKALLEKVRDLEEKCTAVAAASASQTVAAVLAEAQEKAGPLKWSVRNIGAVDRAAFAGLVNALSDEIRTKKLDTVAVVLAGVADGAVMIAAAAGNRAAKEFGVHCGETVKAAAAAAGGSGGGSPTRAQAGGKDPSKLGDALAAAASLLAAKE